MTETVTENRHEFFVRRAHEIGVCDEDSDYKGMIGKSVEELSATFAEQGHSECSAYLTMQLFNQLTHEWDAT